MHLQQMARHFRLGFFVLAAACSDSTGPGIQPEINNIADNFEFQVTAITNYSGTLQYTWSNTGTSANVNQSTVFTAGSARLVITDASGAEVYNRSLADNGTFITTTGQAGAWKVRVVFTGASTTANFRVQKRP
ncbi:MAG TPA: hypothetical protein VF021_02775 [Longimicrobiales bacterium]